MCKCRCETGGEPDELIHVTCQECEEKEERMKLLELFEGSAIEGVCPFCGSPVDETDIYGLGTCHVCKEQVAV